MRHRTAGAAITLGFVCGIAGGVPRFVPTDAALGPISRILDSFAPHLVVAGLSFSLLAVVAGMRAAGLGLTVLLSAVLLQIAASHHALSLPLVKGAEATTEILFFNARGPDTSRSEAIVRAALEEQPDIMVFVEAGELHEVLGRMYPGHAFISPCAGEECDVVVVLRDAPLRFWRLRLNPVWGPRYAVAEIEYAPGMSFFLAASQTLKPWFSGVAETELARLTAQYRWLPGPAVAVGDYNSAPWSRPVQRLMRESGVRGLRAPVATWPAATGRLGIPLDQVLVKNGVRVAEVRPFGSDLGSNHLGLLVKLILP